ncbi:sortase A [Pediococcus ethanolidurans]|uniref:Sortase A n=1 Tax=Pediococcus ethanolidurans TaxID=319653 RepID=A0A0R2K8T4_9LACO|nr:sortase A [Pediococcus ethanolidurans]
MTVVLLIAIGFCGVYLSHDSLSNWLVTRQKITISRSKIAKTKRQADNEANYNFKAVKPLSLTQLSKLSLKKGNLPIVGKIVIPNVKMNLPISRGVESRNLAFSAGTLKATEKMGEANYALAGHHMANNDHILFGPLVRTSVGEKVYVSDMTDVYIYQIWLRKYISANQLAVLNNQKGQNLLTLVTCDDTGTGRLLVQGKLVQKVRLSKLDKALRSQINQN